jgi:hypothetical protein
MQQHWFRLGQILDPKDNYVPSTNIGSCFIEPTNNHILNIFFTHRNSDNISHISKVKFDLKKKKNN